MQRLQIYDSWHAGGTPGSARSNAGAAHWLGWSAARCVPDESCRKSRHWLEREFRPGIETTEPQLPLYSAGSCCQTRKWREDHDKASPSGKIFVRGNAHTSIIPPSPVCCHWYANSFAMSLLARRATLANEFSLRDRSVGAGWLQMAGDAAIKYRGRRAVNAWRVQCSTKH